MPYSTVNALAIALLGVTAPLFVFATTLLGAAIKIAGDKETEIKEKSLRRIEEQIARIREQVTFPSFNKDVEQLKLDQIKLHSELKKIRWKYSLLTSKKSVLYPAGCFIFAIVLNEFARVCQAKGMGILLYGSLWGISILLIFIGSRRICRCLTLVQKVTVTRDSRSSLMS